jgi:hypothetical protein
MSAIDDNRRCHRAMTLANRWFGGAQLSDDFRQRRPAGPRVLVRLLAADVMDVT